MKGSLIRAPCMTTNRGRLCQARQGDAGAGAGAQEGGGQARREEVQQARQRGRQLGHARRPPRQRARAALGGALRLPAVQLLQSRLRRQGLG